MNRDDYARLGIDPDAPAVLARRAALDEALRPVDDPFTVAVFGRLAPAAAAVLLAAQSVPPRSRAT